MSANIVYIISDNVFNDQFTECLSGIIESMLDEYDLSGGEVSVIIGDNELLQNLNRQYRNKDAATDVLSFSYLESKDQNLPYEEVAVGDIYISLEKVRENSEEAGHSLKKETALLTIHGMLHLLGFSHDEEIAAERMQVIERELLCKYDHALTGGETGV